MTCKIHLYIKGNIAEEHVQFICYPNKTVSLALFHGISHYKLAEFIMNENEYDLMHALAFDTYNQRLRRIVSSHSPGRFLVRDFSICPVDPEMAFDFGTLDFLIYFDPLHLTIMIQYHSLIKSLLSSGFEEICTCNIHPGQNFILPCSNVETQINYSAINTLANYQ